jgi:glycosyltransferase involved in cell wall biosynthesis
MQKPKVSVVIPNYNSEDYIHRCIDSLLNQSFKDFELIIIDDGSTDNSGMIADHYASTHSCVKVIHQANSGVSAARQVGLTAARGKYVTFVDPDDWVEPDMLQCLVGKAEQEDVDILFCDFFIDFSPS